jgi:formylglycine-generating enzyme required for sulfatase activity
MLVVAAVGLAVPLVACSLLVSADEYEGGTSAATEASRGDEPFVEAGSDVANEVGPSHPGCPAGRGPASVRVETAAGPYCIDTTEVTRAQYELFLASNPTNAHPRCNWNVSFVPTRAWPYGSITKDHPVIGVDWCDAQSYCTWAGKQLCGAIAGGPIVQGSILDPAKSAFIHACTRGGAQNFPYGATYKDGACRAGATDTIPVGSAPECEGGYPGLFDMVGNAEEWADACSEEPLDGGGNTGADDSCRVFNSGYREKDVSDLQCDRIRIETRSFPAGDVGFRCCARP